jgi:hypothetical protein
MYLRRQLMAREDFKRLGYKENNNSIDNTDNDSKEQNTKM